uniref:Uncharacterized protein n=1 Tax=Panagrolaimus superbus TaxID=310955 RepID=A0A914YZD2_9BILA
MKFQILFLFAVFVFINGLTDGNRNVRQADFQTDQLEAKLLQSNLQTFNGRTDGVSISQNENVAYGIKGTFVFKAQAGTGQNVIRPANNGQNVIRPANNPSPLVSQPRSSLERE